MAKDGKTATPEYAELKRRIGFEFDGMRLHEYYFENLGGKGDLDKSGKLRDKLAGTSAATKPGRRTSGAPARCGESAGSSSTRTM